jgi:hypothetical protein
MDKGHLNFASCDFVVVINESYWKQGILRFRTMGFDWERPIGHEVDISREHFCDRGWISCLFCFEDFCLLKHVLKFEHKRGFQFRC